MIILNFYYYIQIIVFFENNRKPVLYIMYRKVQTKDSSMS